VQALASFFSAFVIAFVKQWKFALILSGLVPASLAIFAVGGTFVAKYTGLVLKEYGYASNLAEEIIASVRTVQAFGTQDKLAKLYDDNLVAAQRTGYKQQFSTAVMLAVLFFCIYSFYGLGFCTTPFRAILTTRGRIEITR
jgi:ATP-binding cassette, subfamily B (MDR/TAP), member 1